MSPTTAWEMELIEDEIVTKSGDRISLRDNRIEIYDGKKQSVLLDTFSHDKKQIYAIALSPDEKYFAVGGRIECDAVDDTYVLLYHYKEKVPFKILMSHTDTVNDLAFSSDSR